LQNTVDRGNAYSLKQSPDWYRILLFQGPDNWPTLNAKNGNYNWKIIEVHLRRIRKKKIDDDANLGLRSVSAITEQYCAGVTR